MNRTEYERILAEGLEEIEAGADPRTIASRYPPLEAELLRALSVAQALPMLGVEPSALAEARSRRALLAAAEEHQRPGRVVLPSPRLRLPAAVPAFIVVAVLLGVMVLAAAAQALPGDALYGAKLQMEAVQRQIAPDPAAVEAAQRRARIEEVRRLIAQDEAQTVRFQGAIEDVRAGVLRVAGVDVWLANDTVVVGDPEVGASAIVSGLTGTGGVIARRIEVIPTGRTETPAQTPAPPPTPSTPVPPDSPTPTPTPELEPSPTQAPASTSPPLPPAATDDDDDDGDDGDDNADDDDVDNDNSDDDADDDADDELDD